MTKRVYVIAGIALAAIIGGLIFVLTAEIPAPSQPVSKTISNDRFPS